MKKKVLIIGGVAAGTKTAAKAVREYPDVEVKVITEEEYVSYAGCGLPYYIGNVIKEKSHLTVMNPEKFKERKVEILLKHKAERIIPSEKRVIVKDLATGETKDFFYDKLVIATGAKPIVPPIPGADLKNVFKLRSIDDAVGIREQVEKHGVKKATVVGGGFIGLEVAENLTQQGVKVTLVELLDQILPNFDREIALLAQSYLEKKGITIFTGEKAVAIEGTDGKVTALVTDKRKIDTELVLLSIGVLPNTELAKEAGIELGVKGAIKVNEHMETNIPDIFAVGDCAENINLITNSPAWYPMGSTSNKMGRVAALNLFPKGEKDSLKGVLGTTVVKLFEMNAARTGLSERDAKALGYDYITVLVPANDRAHYYPGHKTIVTKLIVDKKTHRVLGGQVIGEGVVDKPIDILATLITLKGTVEDLAKIDLAYAPPFSMALSSTIVAANVAVNKLTGRVEGISPISLKEKLGSPDLQIIDVRTEAEFLTGAIPGAKNIPLNELEKRAGEINRDKETILICKVGLRAYLAYRTLKHLGFENIKILDGGVTAWPFELE
ncbi:FAD-dependent oxidoreductase [Thermovenabulum gondwanense]|uniref:NADH peroxidase n=1 Tax=Thermovenabulum gondwanense TaxID=520767 RepID=A0A162M5Q4_9FIRM|nr:FAD-dependent oxidoreductase [Thermovenabulum gondwanense]KYO64130.1 NADH peroxidase [Thermovenabulum gondwanense]